MPGDIKVTLNVDIPKSKAQVQRAILRATRQTFGEDIKNEAKRLSPVSEEWPSIPQQRGEKRIDTGHNRRSIDTETEKSGISRIVAKLFTQSGYGGYLELGYKIRVNPQGNLFEKKKKPIFFIGGERSGDFMQGRPYLWPAFRRFVGLIPERVKQYLK